MPSVSNLFTPICTCGMSLSHTQNDEIGGVQQEWQCISNTRIGWKP